MEDECEREQDLVIVDFLHRMKSCVKHGDLPRFVKQKKREGRDKGVKRKKEGRRCKGRVEKEFNRRVVNYGLFHASPVGFRGWSGASGAVLHVFSDRPGWSNSCSDMGSLSMVWRGARLFTT